jgi:signal transduction histidine kinase
MQLGPVVVPILWLALLIAAVAVAVFVNHRRQRSALRAARGERDHARTGEAAAVRALRLAAIELRGPATTLLGHADRLCADATRAHAGATIGAIARQVLDLADDLQHHALADAASRVLRQEPVCLAGMLNDAIAVAQASLEPGRRHWRVPADIETVELIADRRALAQILARVLGNAARYSRHDDWIDVSLDQDGDRIALVVADEGNGFASVDGPGAPGRADSRGLGLGLALARVLMEAHGGALLVEAVPSVGTRVTLAFPSARMIRTLPAEHSSARAPAMIASATV